jgi:hypothetical protein
LINPEVIVVPENVVAVIGPTVRVPKLAVVPKRLVEEAVVAKELVVVAEVDVELIAVKFWRVVDAETSN